MNRFILSFLIIAAATISFASSAFAYNDPPTRAGRISYIKGDVSLQPGDTDDWTWASMNRPVTTGDNIWVSRRGRAEIRVGSTAIRADQKTSLSILNLDDSGVQLGLNSGTLIVHLRSLPPDGYFEIDTPNVAVTLLRAGDYRIETDESGDFTRVAVRTGKAEVTGNRDSFRIREDSEAEITGSYRTKYDVYDLSPSDDFDRWSRERDWRAARSVSARYVSTELTGYEDLDRNGRWFNDRTYGNVWQPTGVSSSWTPYREGRWAWVEPWGWTWMDDAPWGYATSHYGRWANLSGNRWVWVPPQRNNTSAYRWPVYSPANVVFIRETRVVYRDRPVIAWFPLGPGEAYVPAYRSSRDYLARMNDTNTTWRNRDRYDYSQRRYVSQRDYSNALIAGAVVAVASEIFSSSKPVHRSAVRVDNATFMSKEIARTAPVAPVKASVLAASTTTAAASVAAPVPPRELRERKMVAKKEPPPRRVKFDRKQAELQKTEGAPIDSEAEKKLGASAPAPVSAVTTVQAPVAQAPAPEVTPKERNEQQRAERREQREERKEDRAESKQQREAERAAEKAEAGKLRAEEEAQKKAEQSQQQQQADTARQQRDAERDAAKQQAEQQRAQEEEQRKAEREEADRQRDAAKQQAEQQRAQEEEQRKADREQKLDSQRQGREEADKQRAEEEAQRKAEREEADRQRAEAAAERKAEQEQREAGRQQKQEEERKAREAARQSREPAGEVDQPDASTEPEQTTTEEPVRRHKGPNPRRRGDDADQQGGMTPPSEPAAEPQQQGAAEPAPAPSGPVRIEAGDAEQKLVSQPKLKYPREAEKAGIEGTVKVQTTIGTDGKVKDAIAIDGPDELKDAARENVARRRYQPTVVDGKPVEVQTEVSVDFQKQ
jgi:TonB family protein